MRSRILFLALLMGAASACGSEAAGVDLPVVPPDPNSGGTTTALDDTHLAYANAATNMREQDFESFNFGHALFDRNWVTAPATTDDIDGLGPLLNQRSCSGCHSVDGRAEPVFLNQFLDLLLRLSVPGEDEHGGPLGDPVYGTQLRPNAILGVPIEGTPHVSYEEQKGTFGDGSAFSLAAPTYTIEGWGYGPPSKDLMISPRVGPFTIGLGLLEAIDEADILANQRDGEDGVFGKPNRVWDAKTRALVLGRFGWKANVASVLDQTAGAFQGDMGITSTLNPGETCTKTMTECLAAPSGGTPEADDRHLEAVAFYMRTLAVPARRDLEDETALHGEALFTSFGCASCHVSTFVTHSLPGVVEVEDQIIHPYTDLLLHDMGPGLADGRPDYLASGSEWRTPPLWGIGLLKTVNGHERLLHDGRARGLTEAILWHGGEAENARERFRKASASDRDAIVTFLHSL